MTLLQVIQSQGVGSRKHCLALVASGQVMVNGTVCTQAKQVIHDPVQVSFYIDGELYTYQERILIAMHKPLGYECSAKPHHHPSVLSLLPNYYRMRGVQPVGRLDVDTSGLLLLTDDGQLIHRLTHPKRHIHKTYYVTTKDALTEVQLHQLHQEIQLNHDPKPVHAISVTSCGTHALQLVIDEGRYHQVRRMIAAVGNAVDCLIRTQYANYVLPETLAAGHWQLITEDMLGID